MTKRTSKAAQLERLESTCATLRVVLEWYADGEHQDGGERARLVLAAVESGRDLLEVLRRDAAASRTLSEQLTEARRRLRFAEEGESMQLSALVQTAERYRRGGERHVGWLKDHFGVNCPAAAAARHSELIRARTAAEDVARKASAPPLSLFGRLARHAAPKLPPLRPTRSVIHAVAYLVRGEQKGEGAR